MCRAALALVPLLAGCGGESAEEAGATPPLAVLPAPTGAAPAPSIAPPPDNPKRAEAGWVAGDWGIEQRQMEVTPGDGRPPAPVVVVRLDPARVRLRVAYEPEQARSLRRWFDERRPLLAVNGGFFTEEHRPTALLISDGTASGESYEGFGGMLAVAPDGAVSIRALRDQPYDQGEPLDQAIQSFPMLVFPGGQPAEIQESGERARRTVVAQDRSGRLLLIVSPTSSFTLNELAAWLAGSDLAIEAALNLDGGSSTGLFVEAGPARSEIDSFAPLPIVLLAEPRT